MDEPSATEWSSITEHTHAANFAGELVRIPPYPLILLLRTLVDGFENVTASHTVYEWAPRTTWRTWLFTAGSIASVEASYDEAAYDYDEDLQRYQQRDSIDKPLEADLLASWVRPLTTVSHTGIQDFQYKRQQRPFRDSTADFYPTSIDLGFSDGSSTIISLMSAPDNQNKRDRWDKLTGAAIAAAKNRSVVD
jgi:hypothetical protein